MSISAELLENLLRHCEIRRDIALDLAAGPGSELGKLEAEFWADMVNALIELNAYRDVVSEKKVSP